MLYQFKGNGAPLRNQNNMLVTKLPEVNVLLYSSFKFYLKYQNKEKLFKLNQNIWERFAPKSSNLITNKENQSQPSIIPEVFPKLEEKKKEINTIIDNYSNNSINNNAVNRNSSFSNYKDPKDQSYWNDWFGRPGYKDYHSLFI